MSEQYRKNVQFLCDKVGIQNPIREEDITLDSMVFYTGNTAIYTICGTDMNRAGRLFLQAKFSGPGYRAQQVSISKKFSEVAASHFAELWLDADEKGRSLIIAIRDCHLILLNWKPWLPDF